MILFVFILGMLKQKKIVFYFNLGQERCATETSYSWYILYANISIHFGTFTGYLQYGKAGKKINYYLFPLAP